MKKTFLNLFFAIISISSSFSQIPLQDSLKMELGKTHSDSIHAKVLQQLLNFYINQNTDSLRHYSNLLKQYSEEKQFEYELGAANTGFGIYFMRINNYDSALTYFEDVLFQLTKNKDHSNMSVMLTNIGGINYELGRYEKALDYYFKSLTIADSIGKNGSSELNNIALVYHELEDYRKAIEYYHRSLAINEEKSDNGGRLNSYTNIASSYIEADQMDSGLYFYHKAMVIARKADSRRMLAIIYRNTAHAFREKEQLDSAKYYYELSYQTHTQIDDKVGLGATYAGLGQVYYKKKNYVEALKMYEKARDIYVDLSLDDPLAGSLNQISKTLQRMGRYKEAYEALFRSKVLSDSLLTENNAKTMSEMLVKYETEKKEEKNKFLQAENELKQKSIAERERIILFESILVIALILFLAVLIILMNKLAENRKKLKESNQTKDKLFNIVSHDLRAPIGNLQAISEFLYEEAAAKKDSEFTSILKQNKELIDSTQLMINDLLVWSLSQKDGLVLKSTTIHLKELFEKTVAPIKILATNKEIEIKSNIGEQINVRGDVDAISTVIRNLISNAIKFTPRGGLIALTSKSLNGFHEICVADTGIGMNDSQMEQLFSVRKSGKSIGTENEIGSGIGLTFCKDIVEHGGGKIWVESKPGSGSKFYFTLPN